MSTLTLLITAALLAAVFAAMRYRRAQPDTSAVAAARSRAAARAALRSYEPAATYVPNHTLDMTAFNVVEITDTCDGRGPLSPQEAAAIEAILRPNREFKPRDPWGVAK